MYAFLKVFRLLIKFNDEIDKNWLISVGRKVVRIDFYRLIDTFDINQHGFYWLITIYRLVFRYLILSIEHVRSNWNQQNSLSLVSILKFTTNVTSKDLIYLFISLLQEKVLLKEVGKLLHYSFTSPIDRIHKWRRFSHSNQPEYPRFGWNILLKFFFKLENEASWLIWNYYDRMLDKRVLKSPPFIMNTVYMVYTLYAFLRKIL